MHLLRGVALTGLLCLVVAAGPSGALAAPGGQMTWAVHTTLVPAWFDPADNIQATPFLIQSALHDAVVLRKGVRFHNGDPVTADDVKFSFERYRGNLAKALKERVAAVETPDPARVRVRLKQPWPDFMTFYGTRVTGAAWIVPRKYLEKVGDDGFRKAPVGAGPDRFVSFTPGVELVVEAFEQYWRKVPHMKRLVFRVVPDHATRVAALKRGEVDVVYLVSGEMADDVRRTPGLSIKSVIPSNHWLMLPDQWDPKSPWHDRRVRLAANLALDRQALNDAATLGLSRLSGSIVPSSVEFFWPAPLYPYDPARAKKLLAEAGYPNGFDAGEFFCDLQVCPWSEAMLVNLKAVGIQSKLRPLERAPFFKGITEKKFKGIIYAFLGVSGNAATWLETQVVSTGAYAQGSYPDIDGLFREQANELDRTKREALLHRMQQLVHDKAMFVPIWEFAFLHGVGPRVEESGLGLLTGWGFSSPYEDVKLKAK